ncbi:hypothetical protein QR680_007012 [Steinernema hermaphroditum]|uniref:Uncharacterized protein n=1 Tax=Steinernema hermaphroditum TaxID=289476 RepID=A0AA39LY20_9BILA|nr:hypothetical protein QR680_007012 [Steinernema hermaphroditum]
MPMQVDRNFDKAEAYLYTFAWFCIYGAVCLPFLLTNDLFANGNDYLKDHMTWSGLLIGTCSYIFMIVGKGFQLYENRSDNAHRGPQSPVWLNIKVALLSDLVLWSYCIGFVITIPYRTYVLPDFLKTVLLGGTIIVILENQGAKWILDNVRPKYRNLLELAYDVQFYIIRRISAVFAGFAFVFLFKYNEYFLGDSKLHFENFSSMLVSEGMTDSEWNIVAKALVITPLAIIGFTNLTQYEFRAFPAAQNSTIYGATADARQVGTKVHYIKSFCSLQYASIESLVQLTTVFTILSFLYLTVTAAASFGIGRLVAAAAPWVDDFYGFFMGLMVLNVIAMIYSPVKKCFA